VSVSFHTVLNKFNPTNNMETMKQLADAPLAFSCHNVYNGCNNNIASSSDPLFTVSVYVDGNFTAGQQISEFNYYLSSLRLEDELSTLNTAPGTGGSVDGSGGTGAVLIVW